MPSPDRSHPRRRAVGPAPLVASAALLAIASLAPGSSAQTLQKPSAAGRALREELQPSEAELATRVTPVVRAVRATADSVISVILNAPQRRGPVGQGSGVILDEKGLAITNWHVVALAIDNRGVGVQVKLRNGKSYPARVLSSSREFDLALLQITVPSTDQVQPVTLGDSNSLMIGETMIAIGNPRGHQNTVTVGVLSQTDRSIKVRTPDGRIRDYTGLLQTDAAINQGNSGGALLDITGKLVGINSAVSPDSENIGFAIPVNTVRRVFHEILLASENLTAVYLGMKVHSDAERVILAQVAPDGPAYRAGLRDGDQLMRVNDSRVQNTLDYARSLIGVEPDRPLAVTVRRGAREFTRRPVPMSHAAWSVARRIGLEFKKVTLQEDRTLIEAASRQLARELNQRRGRLYESFLVVTQTRPGSPAADLGIKPGDVLLGIVDRIPDFFGTRRVLNTYDDIVELNNSLHVMANRYQNAEYTIWILRDGGVLDGPLDIPTFHR